MSPYPITPYITKEHYIDSHSSIDFIVGFFGTANQVVSIESIDLRLYIARVIFPARKLGLSTSTLCCTKHLLLVDEVPVLWFVILGP
jgi:hypothetical protein